MVSMVDLTSGLMKDQKTSGTLRFNDNVLLTLVLVGDAELFVDGPMYIDLNSGIGNFAY